MWENIFGENTGENPPPPPPPKIKSIQMNISSSIISIRFQ